MLLLKVAKIAQEMEADLEKKSRIITEEVSMKKHKILILLACKFPEKMIQEFKDLTLEPLVKQCKMRFTGLPNEIIASKSKMFELLSDLKHSAIEKSEDYIKVSIDIW